MTRGSTAFTSTSAAIVARNPRTGVGSTTGPNVPSVRKPKMIQERTVEDVMFQVFVADVALAPA